MVVGSKQIHIRTDIYKDLSNFKTKNDFSSFTEAIRELLEWRRKFAYESIAHRLQQELRDDPGSAESLDCTYIPEYENIGVFPPELKKLIEKDKCKHER